MKWRKIMPIFKSADDMNNEFEHLLKTTDIISKSILVKLHDAYSYDSASTYEWFLSKMRIIKHRIENGSNLPIESNFKTLNKNNFLEWVESTFPNAKKDLE